MIEQNRNQWPPDGDRPRRWNAYFTGRFGTPDCTVIVRHYAILAPGEDLTEYPKTLELTWDEWLTSHVDYGLTVEGQPI